MKVSQVAWAVAMALPGRTVGPAADDVDFQSCILLCVVQSSAGCPGIDGRWLIHQ